MKILELRFKNLNSLYGEWVIDFSDPEYTYNGIFALTGPTGSGKTTLLDAICLALYGATPRLGKITASGNEIMSRQTGECYAEVLFESQTGRFRCHWEQRRARKNPSGKLQDQEHQIADADTGKLLETKKSLVGAVVEAKTGMDFDRFTRSMLLAQGGFDTFLKADIEEKSKILEQITGTGIYSDISRRVHERQREERERLNQLKAETAGITLLTPEQEQDIRQSLSDKQTKDQHLANQAKLINTTIQWQTNIAALEEDILSLQAKISSHAATTDAFEPELAKLKLAEKAALLDGGYATVTALRQQQKDNQTAWQEQHDALPALEEKAKRQSQALHESEQKSNNAKKALAETAPLIKRVRILDQHIATQKQSIQTTKAQCTTLTLAIQNDQQTLDKLKKDRSQAKKSLTDVEEYLKTQSQDEWLVQGLTGIEAQFNNLLEKETDLHQARLALEENNTAANMQTNNLNIAKEQHALNQRALESANRTVQEAKNALQQLLGEKQLREYRSEKDALHREMTLIRRIEILETEREKLVQGKPCPLCGATEHPFAKENVPTPDATEQQIQALTQLIDDAEAHERNIIALEQTQQQTFHELHQSEKRETQARHDKQSSERALLDQQAALTTLENNVNAIKQAVLNKLKPLGITEIADNQTKQLLNSLNTRLQTWQDKQQAKNQIQQQIVTIDSDIRRLTAVIDTQSATVDNRQQELAQLAETLSSSTDERASLFGDKNADDEENRLNKAVADAEAAERAARDQHTKQQQALSNAKANLTSLKERIEKGTKKLDQAASTLSIALTEHGFENEAALLAARLPVTTRQSLAACAKQLADTGTELNTTLKDRESRLTTERDKKLTDQPLDTLENERSQIDEALSALREETSTLKYKLHDNDQAKARIQSKQADIDAQTIECQRWDKLHALIGSADGKKYRNFAQGLTFELMISHANHQLEKMTDRYLLMRDAQQPLELNVIDNYQAGEIRSTKNLSGGESFIISLTLALGLSKMASRQVRVDSLFLDEGFSTLDEEALDTALETLSNLQQDGKLIGVISHVTALKERIGTQIKVTPKNAGRSVITGSGIQRLTEG